MSRYNPRVTVRVYVPEARTSGERLPLSADEAAHVLRVLRLVVGDALRVFDGRGHEWDATLVDVARVRVLVELAGEVRAAPEPRVRYTVAPAVLKGDGTDEVIRDAVMMGVTGVRPHVTARSEIGLAALARGGRRARWARVAVASAKQCGRAVVPEVDEPVAFAELLSQPAPGTRVLLVEPSAGVATRALRDLPAPERATLAVGPEGGWTLDEVHQAVEAGWTPVRLGARTLRATATPLAALAACQAIWQDD